MVLLFAILAAVTGAHMSFLQRMVVRAELENIYGTCCMLQRLALMQGAPQMLIFDQDARSYRYADCVCHLPKSVCFGTAYGVKGPPSSPDYVLANPITFKDSTIIFYPDGIIQSGAVYLTDTKKSCTYALSCAVSKVSYLRKYQYTSSWHLVK